MSVQHSHQSFGGRGERPVAGLFQSKHLNSLLKVCMSLNKLKQRLKFLLCFFVQHEGLLFGFKPFFPYVSFFPNPSPTSTIQFSFQQSFPVPYSVVLIEVTLSLITSRFLYIGMPEVHDPTASSFLSKGEEVIPKDPKLSQDQVLQYQLMCVC